MNDFRKELLGEIVSDWDYTQIEYYIVQLEQRAAELDDWIRYMKAIRKKKKSRKIPLDNGTRGGK